MNKKLEKAQNLGLLEHMIRGGLKGGSIGAVVWKTANYVSALFPPSTPIVLPSAAMICAGSALVGATLEGSTYVMGSMMHGKAVRL
jgi:hypothetical protein